MTAPVIFGFGITVQVYFVPAGTTSPLVPFVSVRLKISPEQISCCLVEMTGVGLTVTTISNGKPTQEPAIPDVGVTR